MPNPEPHWGPRAKAGRYLPGNRKGKRPAAWGPGSEKAAKTAAVGPGPAPPAGGAEGYKKENGGGAQA